MIHSNEQLHNHIAYYEALADGRKDVDAWGYSTWRHNPTVEQRAEAIAEEQRKYLATPLDRHGNKVGISSAVSQFRADVAALKLRKDMALGELAAIGRADVLQEDLMTVLKIVKKLSPTQKARKEAGFKIDYWDQIFNRITLRFIGAGDGHSFGKLVVEMHIIEESGEAARISLAKIITARVYTASFSVRVDWATFAEVIKTYDKERLSLQYRDWINRFVIKQRRDTTRLIVQPPVG